MVVPDAWYSNYAEMFLWRLAGWRRYPVGFIRNYFLKKPILLTVSDHRGAPSSSTLHRSLSRIRSTLFTPFALSLHLPFTKNAISPLQHHTPFIRPNDCLVAAVICFGPLIPAEWFQVFQLKQLPLDLTWKTPNGSIQDGPEGLLEGA